MMYVIFKQDGSLDKVNLDEFIQQGSALSNTIFATIKGWENISASMAIRLPEGAIPATATITGVAHNDVEIEGETYNGFDFTLTNAETNIPGTCYPTIQIVQGQKVLVTYPMQMTINPTGVVVDSETTITNQQYRQMLAVMSAKQDTYGLNNARYYPSLALAQADTNLVEGQYIAVKETDGKVKYYVKSGSSLVEIDLAYLKLTGGKLIGDVFIDGGSSGGLSKLVKFGYNNEPCSTIYSSAYDLVVWSHLYNDMYHLGYKRFYATEGSDLGIAENQWKDLYLSGLLKDGTNSVSVAQIATKTEVNGKVNRSGDTMEGDLGLGNNKLGVGVGSTYAYIENDNGAINVSATQLNVNDNKVATEDYVSTGYVPLSSKGQASGVATLDNNAKIPLSQIPDSVFGQLEYKGVWNATTGTSSLEKKKGDYYVCQTAGNKNPDATTYSGTYEVGDWAVYNGSSWDKVDNTDAVQSVNGMTGAVVLEANNINYDSTYTVKDAIDNLGTTYATKQFVNNKHIIKDGLSISTTDWVLNTETNKYEYELTLSSVSLEHALTINDVVDFLYKDVNDIILGGNARVYMTISETEEYQATTYIKKIKFIAWSIPAGTIEYSLDATRNVRAWTDEGTIIDANIQSALNGKQNVISDLATIRSGASLGATAVQPESGKGLFSGSYNDLTNKPTIPTIIGQHDGTNWTSININGVNKNIPVGGGTGSYTAGTGITILDNEISVDTQTIATKNDLNSYVPTSSKGISNGVASLDENAKILTSQLPDSILGQLKYGGSINSNGSDFDDTNTRFSLSGPAVVLLELSGANPYTWAEVKSAINTHQAQAVGMYFIVGQASGQSVVNKTITLSGLNSGSIPNCSTGDWIIISNVPAPNYILADKIDNTDAVSSVNGKVGAVVLTTSDLTNNSGFITNAVNDLVNYTKTSSLSTVATSGNYSDLNGKPTKLSDFNNDMSLVAVSGTGDDTNWQTITIDGTTKIIPTGGGSTYTAGNGITINLNEISVNQSQLTTKENVSNKVTSMDISSTNAQYPTAKAVYDGLQEIKNVAEGKSQSFIINYGATIASVKATANIEFYVYNTSTQKYENKTTELLNGNYDNTPIGNDLFNSVSATIRDTTSTKYLLWWNTSSTKYYMASMGSFPCKIGDNFYVTNTDVPDRWYGGTGTYYLLESTTLPYGIQYSNASGSVYSNPLKFVRCTQAEYNAITTKDSDTFYIIVG